MSQRGILLSSLSRAEYSYETVLFVSEIIKATPEHSKEIVAEHILDILNDCENEERFVHEINTCTFVKGSYT